MRRTRERRCLAGRPRLRSPSPSGARSSGGAPAAARRRAPAAPRGGPWAARMGLRSSRLSLENRDPGIALQAEREACRVLRIVQYRDQMVAVLAGGAPPAPPRPEKLSLAAPPFCFGAPAPPPPAAAAAHPPRRRPPRAGGP